MVSEPGCCGLRRSITSFREKRKGFRVFSIHLISREDKGGKAGDSDWFVFLYHVINIYYWQGVLYSFVLKVKVGFLNILQVIVLVIKRFNRSTCCVAFLVVQK